MTSESITGDEWLDKLNPDVLYHILWFLDAQSILGLTLVSGLLFPVCGQARNLARALCALEMRAACEDAGPRLLLIPLTDMQGVQQFH